MDGIFGTRASTMLDVVFAAMFLVLPCIWLGVTLIRKKKYEAHRKLMTALSVVLIAVVIAFEIDVRFFHPWAPLAEPSPYYSDPWTSSVVGISLIIHLFFAVTTLVIWVAVVVAAHRNFDRPARPGRHSKRHRVWAKVASFDMLMTAITGWIFYLLAFVAE